MSRPEISRGWNHSADHYRFRRVTPAHERDIPFVEEQAARVRAIDTFLAGVGIVGLVALILIEIFG